MDKVSRRKAIGLVALSALGGTAIAAAPDEEAKAQEGAKGAQRPLKKMTLAEFKALREPAEVAAVLNRLNGGTFMACHTRIREETGIWIPELVPVFRKLDARLVFKALPRILE